jgi:hypothetical protein
MAVYLKCSTAVRCLIHAQAQHGCRPSARAVVIERLTTVPVQDGSTPHGPAPVLAHGRAVTEPQKGIGRTERPCLSPWWSIHGVKARGRAAKISRAVPFRSG